MRQIKRVKELADVPIVAACAVDGANFRGAVWLKDVDHAVFWTEFAQREAHLGGYVGPSTVIPLGVDLKTFFPADKLDARIRRVPRTHDNGFIVGSLNRNQPRKRWDLVLRYFAAWVKLDKVQDAYLYVHTDTPDPTSLDIPWLAQYYGILDRIIYQVVSLWDGFTDAEMRDTYNAFDVFLTCTQGEGFGLTVFEAMACGVPVIAPKWSALGELLDGAAWLVSCPTTAVGLPYVGVIGGVPDEREVIAALRAHYVGTRVRDNNRQAGLERVQEPRYRWETVGREWQTMLQEVIERHEVKLAAPEEEEVEGVL